MNAERPRPRAPARPAAIAAALLAAVVATCAHPGAAAAQRVDHDLQVWDAALATADPGVTGAGPLGWLDVHVRRGAPGTTLIVRPGLGVRAAPWLTLWAGYAWVPVFVDDPGERVDEHRAWQQAIASHEVAGVTLQARTRLEQRFGDGDDVGVRVRQFVRAGWTPAGSPVGLVVWDELFVGANDVDWGPRAGYDQNRLFVGAAAPVGAWGRLEAGYLLVHLDRAPDQVVHALALNLFVSVQPGR